MFRMMPIGAEAVSVIYPRSIYLYYHAEYTRRLASRLYFPLPVSRYGRRGAIVSAARASSTAAVSSGFLQVIGIENAVLPSCVNGIAFLEAHQASALGLSEIVFHIPEIITPESIHVVNIVSPFTIVFMMSSLLYGSRQVLLFKNSSSYIFAETDHLSIPHCIHSLVIVYRQRCASAGEESAGVWYW